MDSFADHPETVGELRANKSESCVDWAPRDALIDVLRHIDGGAKCDAVIVCWREFDESGEERAHFRLAAPSSLVGLGLLSYTAFKVIE